MKKTSEEINEYIKENYLKETYASIGVKIGLSEDAVRKRVRRMKLPKKKDYITYDIKPEEQVQMDLERCIKRDKEKENSRKYTTLLRENELLKKKLEILEAPRDYSYSKVIAVDNPEKSESTAVVLLSDWHMEQLVDGKRLAYPNKYNLEIAKARADECFQGIVKLLRKEQLHQNINTLVLALLGDFITGNIHTSELPNLQLGVAESCFLVEETLIKGIHYILDNTDVKIVCPTAVGNHSRITDRIWISSEQDNSVETIIYYHVKQHFINEERFELIMPYGPDTFLELYGLTLSFCHGHIGYGKYKGGIGGLYVPVRRAIMTRFNRRQVYLACMGHWHTAVIDQSFIVNPSLIGYDDFSNAISAPFSPPSQTFFLIDKKRQCRTVVTPIVFKI